LQALPKDGKPINKWRPQDDGYMSVTDGITAVVNELRGT
jgi:hypothetical protein